MTDTRMALVLGATGSIGGEVARQLAARGWKVRALHRDPATLTDRDDRFEWIKGDAMNQQDVMAAAKGAQIILHAVNPPGYRNWAGLVLPMIDNTIAAARASGARIVLPGTVYNYGPNAFPLLRESSSQEPLTHKGAIRVELERRLQAASSDGVRSLVVRAGDFFGPGSTGNSWFSGGIVKPGKPVRAMFYPGKAGIGHQWAYVPDVARTMVRLIEKEHATARLRDLSHARSLGRRRHADDRCNQTLGRRAGSQGACVSLVGASADVAFLRDYSVRCGRCAICGRSPYAWRMLRCWLRWVRNRIRRGTRRSRLR